MATNVPSPTLTDTGFDAPAELDVLDGVIADINAAFGGNLNPSSASPQGQLANSISAAISDRNAMFLLFCNLVDPALSYGRMQDAIARIYFLSRNAATKTTVTATCIGLSGTVIPAGSLAQADDGVLYESTAEATIPASGTIDIEFTCQETGPIVCAAGSLNTIYQAIIGWDSISNDAAGVTGTTVEGPTEFEARRYASVAANSQTKMASILGSVLSIDGVTDAFGYDNDTGSTIVYRGVTMVPYSIYVAVSGGADYDVANAIRVKKSGGCVYNGSTEITVYDDSSYYVEPFPEYLVKFQRPENLQIAVNVEIVDASIVPSNAESLIQQAIIGAFAGEDDGDKAKIGTDMYASRFYSTVAALGKWAKIEAIKIGSANDPLSEFTATVSGTTMTVSAVASGTIEVDQYLYGDGVTAGITILSQSSGTTGGVGVYVISASLTIGTDTDMKTYLPDQDKITINMDQKPVTGSETITVTLV